MSKKGEWPKAIFYDSKNTLWAWDNTLIKSAKNILNKYESNVDPKEFLRMWMRIGTGLNHRAAFGTHQKFTKTLEEGLEYTFKYFGIPGNAGDVKFITELYDEVQPFPDTIPALTRQMEITKVLTYSNVETEYLDMLLNKLDGLRPHFIGDMDKSQSCKPSPRAYHWVLENASRELNLDLNVSNVLYCAGVLWDVEGAMACGMKAAIVRRPYRYPPPDYEAGVKADYVVDDLHELTKIVEASLFGD
jgi:2-haloalkanoic acid dehalogenase type II